MKRKKCPRCGKSKPENEVYERINPYDKEIHDWEHEELMCNDCDDDLAGDI